MLRNRLIYVLSMLIIASMLLSACGGTATATANANATQAPAATKVPVATTRHGGWLDEIVFSVVAKDSAVTQLKANAIDVYAGGLSSADYPTIKDAGLSYGTSNGLYYDMLYNPAVCKDAAVLNPFSNRKIREATNWLYDRNYINQEVFAGGGLVKYFVIQTNGPDYADFADIARGIEAKYAYNPEKAKQIISDEMKGMGATLGTDGKWMFNGKPVNLGFLIRTDSDGTRKPIGDYIASQLESVGFTVDLEYKKASEAAPLWIDSDPVDCSWSIYTAAWSAAIISRDERNMFQQMYLNTSVQGMSVFLANKADPEFQKLGDDLNNGVFTTLDQRRDMFAKAMELSLEDSLQVFLIDGKNYIPYNPKVEVTSDLAAGIEGAQIYPYTVRFIGKEGGQLKWGEPDLFVEPWNPVAGSNSTVDKAAINATLSGNTMNDPYTGLQWPLRIEKGDVTVLDTLPPTIKTLDWVTLNTAHEIKVPSDAWIDWDAKTQKFLTVADAAKAKDEYGKMDAKATELAGAVDLAKLNDASLIKAAADLASTYSTVTGVTVDVAASLSSDDAKKAVTDKVAEIKGLGSDDDKKAAIAAFAMDTVGSLDDGFVFGLGTRDVTTAKVKSVVTYPADWNKVKWHDGSTLNMADIIMGLIVGFDRSKKDSPIYDEASVPGYESSIGLFKGIKIVSTDPLVIESYTDLTAPDAELMVGGLWPNYGFGEASWDAIAIANKAEADGKLAYSADKATAASIEQTSFIGGPSLDILSQELDAASAESYIPYAPTMSAYVTADEAKARYDNLKAFYTAHGHFWVGTGPYVLDKVFLTEKSLILKNFADYPDLADRWSGFGEPKLPDVTLDGDGQVKIGNPAVFDVNVTFKGDPYPADGIKEVKYLVYNAKGEVVNKGLATLDVAGHYVVNLGADITSKLETGSNKVEVAVIPISVAEPVFNSFEFVTTK